LPAPAYPRVATFRTPTSLRAHLAHLGVTLPFDDELVAPAASPLARPIEIDGFRVGNRFCILPMEGWDGTSAGAPTPLTRQRWRNFGRSGAKLIFGGEAVAVRADGRANPNQLLASDANQRGLAELREELVAAHRERFGQSAERDLLVGLQLTHSGRFARPHVWDRPEPLIAYHHPVLDRRFRGGVQLLSDDDLEHLVAEFVRAARLAHDAGFAFVDVKQCHGYLGHELLSSRDRSGRYGGSFENRTRFLREVIDGIRAEVPGLRIAVRISAFDTVPYARGDDGLGRAEVASEGYRSAFGLLSEAGMNAALDDCRAVLRLLEGRGVRLVCLSAGSPYYNPHVQRPALFPPSDGYLPPEDPLVGVARHLEAAALVKKSFPNLAIVGSGYTYLQEWLPHVAQHQVRQGLTDFVGLGRLVLSYPEWPADLLSGAPLKRKQVCRTFSDCTTAPRMGLVSGCYPLDDAYANHPDAPKLEAGKARLREALAPRG
jgi:2,4-dienoyl-CoA reductase-like NADH-dependent reductase (Old Yellow Enzyme family)